MQDRALVHGDVIGLVALDLVLRFGFAGMPRVAFVFRVARVDLDDSAGNVAGLGIPPNMIADFELYAVVACPAARRIVSSASERGSYSDFDFVG